MITPKKKSEGKNKLLKTFRLAPDVLRDLRSCAQKLDRSQAWVLEKTIRNFCTVKNLTP
jgi:predicted transcriptional regulator